MSVCRFCGLEKGKLVKSHIFPKRLIRRLDKERRLVMANVNQQERDYHVQSLPYVHDILCKDCDGGIFCEYDKVGYRFFELLDSEVARIVKLHVETHGRIVSGDELKNDSSESVLSKLTGIDVDKSKLFFLSVLLRMSFSREKEYKNVYLGEKYEKKFIELLNSGVIDCDCISVAPIVTIAEGDNELIDIVNHICVGPTVRKERFSHQYTFRIGNVWCLICVGSKIHKKISFVDSQIWNNGFIYIPVIPENGRSKRPWVRETTDMLSKLINKYEVQS